MGAFYGIVEVVLGSEIYVASHLPVQSDVNVVVLERTAESRKISVKPVHWTFS